MPDYLFQMFGMLFPPEKKKNMKKVAEESWSVWPEKNRQMLIKVAKKR